MPRMLVVDDEPKICDCLKAHFAAKGFSVACASSGTEAIDWLMDHPADVVLLDIRLPDMLGIEVLKRAKDLRPEAKVVMVTALDDEERAIEAKVYGACGYVTKPFDFSDLTWQAVFEPSFPGRASS
ncbi:MAG: response regulator [Candidatus Omnitrophica bacterium]|nr:response regulator [Candidatus Omnitrophota bacterium]